MRTKFSFVVIAIICAGLLTARAADEKSDAKPAKGRLTQPWSKISSLSDDQKSKIIEIHRKALDEKKAIEKREAEEIMALLNDDQKKEVEALEATKSPKKKSDGDTAAPTTAAAS